MEIIDDTSANWLVEFDDGTTETVAKSKQNRLMMDYDLWGVLRDGTEVFTDEVDGNAIALVPNGSSREFTLQVGDFEPLILGAHQKGRIIDALFTGKDSDNETTAGEALLRIFDNIREEQVRSNVIEHFADLSVFDDVTEDPRGWLFHGHLLLTYEAEFYHPETTSRNRSGGVVEAGSNQEAYDVDITETPDMEREITISGTTYRLTSAEMEFIAKALWAVRFAPKGVL